jgi:hypothetical protein
METHKFSINSWHYQMTKFLFPLEIQNVNDLCGYLRLVIAALMISTVIFIVASTLSIAAAFGTANLLAWIVFVVLHGLISMDGPAVVVSGVIIAISAAMLLNHIANNRRAISNRIKSILPERWVAEEQKDPSFITLAYRSLKSKICYKVEFIDSEEDN